MESSIKPKLIFDSISIKVDAGNVATIEFWFEGLLVVTMRKPGVDFKNGDTLCINNFEGSMDYKLMG